VQEEDLFFSPPITGCDTIPPTSAEMGKKNKIKEGRIYKMGGWLVWEVGGKWFLFCGGERRHETRRNIIHTCSTYVRTSISIKRGD
jgi:hypothetical protein